MVFLGFLSSLGRTCRLQVGTIEPLMTTGNYFKHLDCNACADLSPRRHVQASEQLHTTAPSLIPAPPGVLYGFPIAGHIGLLGG